MNFLKKTLPMADRLANPQPGDLNAGYKLELYFDRLPRIIYRTLIYFNAECTPQQILDYIRNRCDRVMFTPNQTHAVISVFFPYLNSCINGDEIIDPERTKRIRQLVFNNQPLWDDPTDSDQTYYLFIYGLFRLNLIHPATPFYVEDGLVSFTDEFILNPPVRVTDFRDCASFREMSSQLYNALDFVQKISTWVFAHTPTLANGGRPVRGCEWITAIGSFGYDDLLRANTVLNRNPKIPHLGIELVETPDPKVQLILVTHLGAANSHDQAFIYMENQEVQFFTALPGWLNGRLVTQDLKDNDRYGIIPGLTRELDHLVIANWALIYSEIQESYLHRRVDEMSSMLDRYRLPPRYKAYNQALRKLPLFAHLVEVEQRLTTVQRDQVYHDLMQHSRHTPETFNFLYFEAVLDETVYENLDMEMYRVGLILTEVLWAPIEDTAGKIADSYLPWSEMVCSEYRKERKCFSPFGPVRD